MPSASEQIAERLAADGGPVRITGAGTKQGWGRPVEAEPLPTTHLDRIVAHEAGDFTAVLEAGVALTHAQEVFTKAGQRLSLDPPDADGRATIGGIVASGDSGPLRHRYGAPRDLVIGVTLALADGTLARAGGRVIKNVAGYDLPKLAAGSFGTLGVITEVAVRLHPAPARTATTILRSDDPDRLQRHALDLAHRPLEAEALDVRWDGAEGAILVRFGGAAAPERARAIAETIDADDEALWQDQRARQRGDLVTRVAGLPTDLATVLRLGHPVVGRAGVGTYWISGADPKVVRDTLHPRPCVVTDAPADLRAEIDPWDIPEGPELDLMRRVKQRFDPDGVCNPGLFG